MNTEQEENLLDALTEMNLVREENAQLRAEVAEFQAELRNAQTKLCDALTEAEGYKAEVARLNEATVIDLNDKRHQCTLELALSVQGLRETADQLRARVEELEKLYAEERAQNPTLVHRLIEDERDQLRARVAELEQWKKESSDQLVQCGWDMSKMHQKIAELEQDKAIIDVPSQTAGDGTSSGLLSVFARGWNGYINTLREMHPNIKFREGCIDVSGRFHGDMSMADVNAYLRAVCAIHQSFCDEALTLCEDTGIAANIIAKMRELREQSLARIAEARKGQP